MVLIIITKYSMQYNRNYFNASIIYEKFNIFLKNLRL